jgi:hypothetical protein
MPSNTLTFHPKVNCFVDKWQVSWLSQLLLPSRTVATDSTMVFVAKAHFETRNEMGLQLRGQLRNKYFTGFPFNLLMVDTSRRTYSPVQT